MRQTLTTLTTRGKRYGFSVGEKQSYKTEAVSRTYTSHPGLLPLYPTPLDPTNPWAHVHNPAKRSDPEQHLKDAAAMRMRQHTHTPHTYIHPHPHTHTQAAAVAAAKSSLVVPFGRLLLLRVLFLLLLLPLATFFEPC